MLRLKAPITAINNGQFRISCEMCEPTSTRILWFEVDTAYQGMISTDTMDAFVLACLIPAMVSGQDIAVEGPMSGKLYYNLTHSVIAILRQYLPESHAITITPASLHGLAQPYGYGVIAGFSGGIDSFCNYYDHSGNRAPPEYHITHFVYNNVGSHGQHGAEADVAIFTKRFSELAEYSTREGKPFIKVNSNLDEIMGMDFELTHTIRNAATALLMQNTISKFLYASSYAFKETKIAPDPVMGCLDPVILPLVSTERIECIASGGQHTRVAKTEIVAGMKDVAPFLDVCVNPLYATTHRNCSYCWKCLRTELTLCVLGKLEDFSAAFDIGLYRRYEPLYLIEVLSSTAPLSIEMAEIIRERKFKVSRSIRFLSWILPETVTRKISGRLIPILLRRHKACTYVINLGLSM